MTENCIHEKTVANFKKDSLSEKVLMKDCNIYVRFTHLYTNRLMFIDKHDENETPSNNFFFYYVFFFISFFSCFVCIGYKSAIDIFAIFMKPRLFWYSNRATVQRLKWKCTFSSISIRLKLNKILCVYSNGIWTGKFKKKNQ